jgi:hypothetical protein
VAGQACNPRLEALIDACCTEYQPITMDDIIFTGLEREDGIYRYEITLFKEAVA